MRGTQGKGPAFGTLALGSTHRFTIASFTSTVWFPRSLPYMVNHGLKSTHSAQSIAPSSQLAQLRESQTQNSLKLIFLDRCNRGLQNYGMRCYTKVIAEIFRGKVVSSCSRV
jgi:hypothetical protein